MGRQDQVGRLGNLNRLARPFFLILFTSACLAQSVGCTRNFFRKQADQEVADVLAEKDNYPDSSIEQWHVYPDPRARFADDSDPDHPLMPPDDPEAWQQSPHPQKPGKDGTLRVVGAGYLELLGHWNSENREEKAKAASAGRALSALSGEPAEVTGLPGEPPISQGPQSGTTNGLARKDGGTSDDTYTSTILRTEPKPGGPQPYLLNLDQACELSVINAREYQDAREDLYLAALPVTLERFSFAAQFFAAEQSLREWAGATSPDGRRNDWTMNSNAGFAKLFSTGALLLFNFANQTVFNLGGAARPVTSQSTINLDLFQPLLQGGGRAVTLEPLTQAERNLVYQIRNYARFRKSLYVAIAGGGGGAITGSTFQPQGVVASPTFSPNAGVGASGLTPGVITPVPAFGNPGLQVTPGESGQQFLNTALAAPVSGYLTTLLQASQMQVDKYNIRALEGFFKLAKALQEGGDISQLQTDTFEQQLLRGRQSLLMDQQNYLQAIDNFKLQLGVPTDTSLELDDSPFRPLNQQFARFENLFREFKAASAQPGRFSAPNQVGQVRAELRRLLTSSAFVRGTQFKTQIAARLDAWQNLTPDQGKKRVSDFNQERNSLLDKQVSLGMKSQELSAAEQHRLAQLVNEIALGEYESALREYERQPWKNPMQSEETQRRRQQAMFGHVANEFTVVLIEARNERLVQIRAQWPILSPVCVDGVDLLKAELDAAEAAAAQHALIHRLDLMNVRAQNVDAWRQLKVYANALLAPLNVQYALTSTTPAGAAMPLAFSGSGTQQQIILSTDLPIVRKQQRNNYRASLIAYQRSRRVVQRAEDEVMYDVRQELILLRQYLENYKIQTRQIELAYLTVDNSLDTLQAPPTPTPAGGASIDTATRAASLTNQLIQAQTSLYTSLFTMTTIWITYLNTRDQIYRDMELMPLDSRGVWLDEVAKCECPPETPGAAAGSITPTPMASPGGTQNQRPQMLPAPQPGASSQPTPPVQPQR